MNRDEQLKQWRMEAKIWILTEGSNFIEAAHHNQSVNPEITVGQIVAYLDSIPPVPGYELLRPENSLRYQVVRSVIETAARAGAFEVGSTTNSRGRESKCFSPVGWVPKRRRRPSFTVEVDSPNSAADAAKLTEWLETHNIDINALYIEKVA